MSNFHKLTEKDFSEQIKELDEKIRQFSEAMQKIMDLSQTDEELRQAGETFTSLFLWFSDRHILLIYNREKGIWEMPETTNEQSYPQAKQTN